MYDRTQGFSHSWFDKARHERENLQRNNEIFGQRFARQPAQFIDKD